MLASVWQNLPFQLDTTDDGFTSPVDALIVINELNAPEVSDSQGRLPATKPAHRPFFDADGDQFVAPLDALLVINLLNAQEGTLRVIGALAND